GRGQSRAAAWRAVGASLPAVPAKTPNVVSSMPIACPSQGKNSTAAMLNTNTVDNAYATFVAAGLSTGVIAAIAEAPQIAVPTPMSAVRSESIRIARPRPQAA